MMAGTLRRCPRAVCQTVNYLAYFIHLREYADKVVAKAYDVPGPMGFYRRSVFVVDSEGIVRYVHRSLAGLSFRSVDELADALAEL